MIKSTDSVVKISDKNSGIELELGLRPVAIDCANLACFYDYCRPIGSAFGPLEAYRYFKSKGHVTKVFIHQFRLCNKREGKRMRDVEFLLDGIPEYDRPLVPSGSDDDAFVIQWAIENNAIIITNDQFRDHANRFEGRKMENSLCKYTFVDDKFLPDPDFNHHYFVKSRSEIQRYHQRAIQRGPANSVCHRESIGGPLTSQ